MADPWQGRFTQKGKHGAAARGDPIDIFLELGQLKRLDRFPAADDTETASARTRGNRLGDQDRIARVEPEMQVVTALPVPGAIVVMCGFDMFDLLVMVGIVRGLAFHIALNYGSRGEILQAVRAIAREAAEGRLDPAAIGERGPDDATLEAVRSAVEAQGIACQVR